MVVHGTQGEVRGKHEGVGFSLYLVSLRDLTQVVRLGNNASAFTCRVISLALDYVQRVF